MEIKKFQDLISDMVATAATKGETLFIKFGGIDWRVLAVENDKALLISEKILGRHPYDREGGDGTWENCTLRKYLNGEFYNKLGAAKHAIAETQSNNPDNLWCGTSGGNATTDKIFLLSLEEVDKYFGDSGDYLNKRRNKDRDNGTCMSNAYNKNRDAYLAGGTYVNPWGKEHTIEEGAISWHWWLRSPGGDPDCVACVDSGGIVAVIGFGIPGYGGVRPALWLDLQQALSSDNCTLTHKKIYWNNFDGINKLTELINNVSEATVTQKGSTVFVKFRGIGIDWRVLRVDDYKNKALLISEKIIGLRPYNTKDEDVTWEKCTLREYLNGEFYDRLGAVKHAIAETRSDNPDNHWYGTNGGNATTDKIFLLSLEEADKYFGDSGDYIEKRRRSGHKCDCGKSYSPFNGIGSCVNNVYNEDRKARMAKRKHNFYDCGKWWWWLRSPGGCPNKAARVGTDGRVVVDGGGYVCNYDYGGVRPAFWLNLG